MSPCILRCGGDSTGLAQESDATYSCPDMEPTSAATFVSISPPQPDLSMKLFLMTITASLAAGIPAACLGQDRADPKALARQEWQSRVNENRERLEQRREELRRQRDERLAPKREQLRLDREQRVEPKQEELRLDLEKRLGAKREELRMDRENRFGPKQEEIRQDRENRIEPKREQLKREIEKQNDLRQGVR